MLNSYAGLKEGTDFAYLPSLMSHYLIVMIHKFCVYIKLLLSAYITDFFILFYFYFYFFYLTETVATTWRIGFCLLQFLIPKSKYIHLIQT